MTGGSGAAHRDPETQVLLAAARTEPDDATLERVRGLLAGDLRWDVLVGKARFHGVRPLLWWTLSRLDQGAVPGEHLEQLREAFRANAARGPFMQREAVRVLGVLTEAGVRAVPYKGPILATTVYGNVALRTYTDLDIVVRPDDAPRAVEALVADAFVLDDPEEAQHRRQRWHHDLRREDGRVLLELHWTFAPSSWRVLRDLDAIWSRLETGTVGDDPVTAFGPEDQLAMLTVHGAHHFWVRLLWVCDIAELVRSRPDMDWPSVVERSRREGTLRLVLLGLALAEELLDAPLPSLVVDEIAGDPEVRALAAQLTARMLAPAPVEPEGREATRLYLAMRERWREKAVFLAEPNHEDLAAVALPERLSGLYWAVRPVHLVAKSLRRAGAAITKR